MPVRRRRALLPRLLPPLLPPLLAMLLAAGCGRDEDKRRTVVPIALPEPGVAFAYVDVAEATGYTLLNRTGKSGRKNYILEAMAPGIAVGDFDGDGWMDLYCPNGNDILRYDAQRREATLLPPGDAPRNALFLNEGGRRFREVGRAAGVDDTRWSFGTVAGDIDNDGDTDLYVCNWGANRLYLNRGDATFEDVAPAAGATGDPRHWSTAACLVDYDNDGDLDIYVAQYADVYNMLERPDVTTLGPNGEVDGRNCEWKGLKVYCGPVGLVPLNDMLLCNRLVETGTLRFEDVSARAGIRFELTKLSTREVSEGPFYGFQPIAWDIDGNGWQDVFVANDSVRNCCWMNRGDGTFEDQADIMGLAIGMSEGSAQASMGAALGDIDRDGLQDLVVTEFSHDHFNLLIGERLPNGRILFSEKAPKTGLRALTFLSLGWGALLFDPDLDGDLDIYFACGHVYPEVDGFKGQDTTYRQYNLLILNQDPARLKFASLRHAAGPGLEIAKATRAAVVIDFDNDGDPDIATTEMNDTPSLLRCDVDRRDGARHWLAVRLRGNPAAGVARDPAGAVVTVEAGGVRQSRVLLLGSSFQSSEDPRLLFGLDASTEADVEITWPNGRRTRHAGLPADRLHEIELE